MRGSCYLLAGHQQDAVFLSVLHLSENVIQDQKFRPAVVEQLHLIPHLQEAHTEAEKERDRETKMVLKHVYSLRFTRFSHVYTVHSDSFVLSLLFTENLDHNSLKPTNSHHYYSFTATVFILYGGEKISILLYIFHFPIAFHIILCCVYYSLWKPLPSICKLKTKQSQTHHKKKLNQIK